MECNSHINSIIYIFKSSVTVEDTFFDLAPEYDKYICFKNGIYNLDTSEFRRRDISDRFTTSLDWDYNAHYCETCYDDIQNFFSKIQPEQEQRTFTISFLKYCLKGGNPQKLYKMNIGYTAANGKSTEMEMHQAVFPIYTYELENTFFSKTCTMRHKYGAKIVEFPIRLAFIEELDEAQLDENFMKKFGNCQNIQLQKMYDTMTDNSRTQCKLITTSNKDPNMKLDKGLIRRTLIQKYESQFVSKNAVNESKNCYLMDTTWVETRFSQDSYKLAYFHFLLKEGHVQPEIIVPESNVQLVQDQVLENDDFLVKLNEHFVITKD